MDDELYQTFITESEESITQLNNSLLELESNPSDEAAIDDIFRRAHTLKGNFGAMGFDDAATVAHAVEDLLDEVRQGRLDATPERMDLVFEGVDRILDSLHDIERTGESTVATGDVVSALHEAATATGGANSATAIQASADADGVTTDATDGADVADASDVPGADDGPDADDVPDAIKRMLAVTDAIDEETLTGLENLLNVAVSLDGGDMKGVDAGLFLSGIPDAVEVVGSSPPMTDIENGEYGDSFELYVAGLGAEAAAETFAGLWAVSDATVTDASAAIDRAGTDVDGATDGPDVSSEGIADVSSEATAGADASSPPSTRAKSGNELSEAAADTQGREEAQSVSAVKSVRVDVSQLDELHELVEQLVTSRIKLRRAMDDADAGLDTMDELDKISSNLQNTVMDMRLIPLKKVFDKFPRLVRDLARTQDKRVNFEVEGQDIELDRTILDEISDPLMHVLRNAVDHGIEPPTVREERGKPAAGTVTLSARREHDTVVITIADDGEGLDVDRLREKAVEKGVVGADAVAAMPDEEVYELVFHPGFSTNDEITDVSGRGVGMDVVKTTVESLDGSVTVDSESGDGTTFRIRLPVSVAIVKVLFVEVGSQSFGVPIKYIDEISRLTRVDTVNGAEVVVHDDRIFPLVRLRDALGVSDPAPDGGMVVRIRPEDRQIALRCDRVSRQEEVVVTPLQGPLAGAEGLSGTSVIGDGNVIPILDVGTLELPAAARHARDEPPETGAGATVRTDGGRGPDGRPDGADGADRTAGGTDR